MNRNNTKRSEENMELVKIEEVRIGQIWKDNKGRLYLIGDDTEEAPVDRAMYYKCDKRTFAYLEKNGHKLIGFLGITHEAIDGKLVEIIPAYEENKVHDDDIVIVKGEDRTPYPVVTTYNSSKYKDYISLLSYHKKEFTEEEVEKVGTLGVNYEFINSNLLNKGKKDAKQRADNA